MEDILALLLVIVAATIFGVVVYRFVKFINYHKGEAARNEAKFDMKYREMERSSIQRTLERERALRSAVANKPPARSTTPTYASAPSTRMSSTTTPAPVNNWSDDLLTTMIIADMLTGNKDVSAGTVKWKDDVPVITETYSRSSSNFGLDDSDSRKSVSNTFSDSTGGWGSSDSSSSSSDSGPSSDW